MNPEPGIILLGDGAIARALRSIFRDSKFCVITVPFELEHVDATLDGIRRAYEACAPFLVVACCPKAWAATRELNAHYESVELFGPRKTHNAELPCRVIQLCELSEPSVFDMWAAGPLLTTPPLEAILSAAKASRRRRPLSQRALHNAILGYLMAEARHALRPGKRSRSHDLNDVHAALRIIQGAALENVITRSVMQTATGRILAMGEKAELTAKDVRSQELLQLCSRLPIDCELRQRQPHASLFVIDDRPFWRDVLTPIGDARGFTIEMAEKPEDALKELKCLPQGKCHCVLLDMQINENPKVALRIMRTLHAESVRRATKTKHVAHTWLTRAMCPIVSFTVDDFFSEAAILKKMGGFGFLNKHSLAEGGPGRSARRAYLQVRDAIDAAMCASVVSGLHRLWIVMWKSKRSLGLASSELSALHHSVGAGLSAFADACRMAFNSRWQDAAEEPGSVCRRTIRALGLINDSWCKWWNRLRMYNPDATRELITSDGDKYRTLIYHHIITSIRGIASHDVVRDAAFQWDDVWIILYALLLKMDDALRSVLHVRQASREAKYLADADRAIATWVDVWAKSCRMSGRAIQGMGRSGVLVKRCYAIGKRMEGYPVKTNPTRLDRDPYKRAVTYTYDRRTNSGKMNRRVVDWSFVADSLSGRRSMSSARACAHGLLMLLIARRVGVCG